jgi:hypothetical protein
VLYHAICYRRGPNNAPRGRHEFRSSDQVRLCELRRVLGPGSAVGILVLGLVRGDRAGGDGVARYAIFGYHPGPTPIKILFELVIFLPSLAVAARRLHDTDRTAWWLLLLITLIGAIALIVWYCEEGTPGPNRFGPAPVPAA